MSTQTTHTTAGAVAESAPRTFCTVAHASFGFLYGFTVAGGVCLCLCLVMNVSFLPHPQVSILLDTVLSYHSTEPDAFQNSLLRTVSQFLWNLNYCNLWAELFPNDFWCFAVQTGKCWGSLSLPWGHDYQIAQETAFPRASTWKRILTWEFQVFLVRLSFFFPHVVGGFHAEWSWCVGGWNDGSAVKSFHLLIYGGPGPPEPTLGDSQLPETLVPGGLIPASGLHGHLQTHYSPSTHANIIIIINKQP